MGYNRLLFFYLSLSLLPLFAISQQAAISPFEQSACVSSELHALHAQRDPAYVRELEQQEKFYRYVLSTGRPGSQLLDNRSGDACDLPYIIPVVVHVIHLGEAVGSGSNISDIQIQDAIRGLNDYYGNTNGLGARVEMEFQLARRNPNGQSTNGIVRVDGSGVSGYTADGITWDGTAGADEKEIKDLSKWPIDQYYNIWVVHEIHGSAAGYAYYPTSSYAYDGTVIESRYMKSNYTVLAHELGHGFNLRHTFEGDGGNQSCPADNDCSQDGDKVCDTPPHKQGDCGSINPCSSTGDWANSRRNFMSYCSGANRFTEGQRIRILAALKGIRSPLISSKASVPANELREVGIVKVKYPGIESGGNICTSPFQPFIKVQNFGTRRVQSLQFSIKVDGVEVALSTWSGNIQGGKSDSILLKAIPVQPGEHILEISLTDVNGQGRDSYASNDVACQKFQTVSESRMEQQFNFENQQLPPSWQVNSPDFPVHTTPIQGCNGNGSYAWLFENNGYGNAGTYTASVIWDPIDLSQTSFASLAFDLATREEYYCNVYVSLDISVSTDCGQNFTSIYFKNNARKACGGNLATKDRLHTVAAPGSSQADPFVPSDCSSWRHENLDLANFIGQQVIVKFTVEKTFSISQNLYLDNVQLETCALQATANRTDISCFGETDGMILVETSGEMGEVSYEWNTTPVSNSHTVDQLAAGQYTCIVTDSAMCTDTISIAINEPENLDLELEVSDVSCHGTTDGKISSIVFGGVAPYSFTWDHGSHDSTISQLDTGSYVLTITDAHGCKKEGQAKVASPDSLHLEVSTTPANGSNGTATALIRGGVGPYSYSWSSNPVQNGSIATDLKTGMYTLTVTDAHNCSIQKSVFIDNATRIEDIFTGLIEARIYPNPFEHSLLIELVFDQPQPLQIKLYDLTGKLIFEDKVESQFNWKRTIPTEKLGSGMYVLSLQGQNKVANVPIIRK